MRAGIPWCSAKRKARAVAERQALTARGDLQPADTEGDDLIKLYETHRQAGQSGACLLGVDTAARQRANHLGVIYG